MPLQIELREVNQPSIHEKRIVGTICDRCGDNGHCSNANVFKGQRGGGPWGVAHALIQGGGRWEAVLCRKCSANLREWILAGQGPGVEEILG